MALVSTASSLPLLPISIMTCIFIFIFIFICRTLFPKIMPEYITRTAAHLAWAWDFLLHHSVFPNSHHRMNFPGNGDQGLNLGLYKPEPEVAGVCAVCLSKIGEEEEIKELRCAHKFHRDCMDRWVQHRSGTCPLCRGPLALPRMVNELAEEVIVFKFCSVSPGRRTMWWLR